MHTSAILVLVYATAGPVVGGKLIEWIMIGIYL